MMKKVFIIVLIMFIFFLFNGCDGDDDALIGDFEGKTVVFGSYLGFHDQDEEHFRKRVDDIEEEFNVNIEFSDLSYQQLVEEFITSVKDKEPIVDVIEVPRSILIEKFLREDILYPLSEFLDDEYFEKLPSYHQGGKVRNYMETENEFYMFSANGGHMEAFKIIGNAWGILWNKSIFEREGLTDLYDLYENGNWTWAQFLEIARDASRDITGDGELDYWGFANWAPWQSRSSLQNWFLTNNVEAAVIEGEELMFNLDQETSLDVFDFLRDLQNYRGPTGESEFLDNRVAMLITPLGIAYRAYEELVEDNGELGVDLGLMLMPKGPEANENLVFSELNVFALPITSENPEAKLELTNALFQLTADYRNMDTYIDNIIEFRKQPFNNNKTEEMLTDIFEKWQPGEQYLNFIPEDKLASSAVSIVQYGNSPSVVMEELKLEVQPIFNKF